MNCRRIIYLYDHSFDAEWDTPKDQAYDCMLISDKQLSLRLITKCNKVSIAEGYALFEDVMILLDKDLVDKSVLDYTKGNVGLIIDLDSRDYNHLKI